MNRPSIGEVGRDCARHPSEHPIPHATLLLNPKPQIEDTCPNCLTLQKVSFQPSCYPRNAETRLLQHSWKPPRESAVLARGQHPRLQRYRLNYSQYTYYTQKLRCTVRCYNLCVCVCACVCSTWPAGPNALLRLRALPGGVSGAASAGRSPTRARPAGSGPATVLRESATSCKKKSPRRVDAWT